MPGCLGLDALWQLLGFFLGWIGAPGRGRALGVSEVKLTGQILPTATKVTYRLDLKRVINRKLVLGIADGIVQVEDRKSTRLNSITNAHLVCRLLLEKKKNRSQKPTQTTACDNYEHK